MCQSLEIIIDCICSSRVVENYYKSNCDCDTQTLDNLVVNICYVCYHYKIQEFITKIQSVFERFSLGSQNEAYYEGSPNIYVEKITSPTHLIVFYKLSEIAQSSIATILRDHKNVFIFLVIV